ncbi:glutathione synthetase-like [Physella acuta]|uniref:glutathione synthetase-like n=1 Tax=Physella acuta TaxID=109671 RepID=UPI0027DD602D|nr:glutathione synthetase-like [Physella acuta]
MATSVKEINLTERRLEEILDVANDWSLSHGICIMSDDVGSKKAVPAPYSLFPSVVPASVLQQAKDSMVHFSRLMHKVALDHNFLEASLKNVIKVDEFMKNLWDIYLKVREKGVIQPLHFGIFRNDFMMNCLDTVGAGEIVSADRLELKQIEFNAISSSFAGLTEQMADLHRLTLGMCGKSFENKQIPINIPATKIAEGLIKAWELYRNPNAVILYIVSSSERNIIDQRWLEFNVYKTHPHIRVLRRTFAEINDTGHLGSEHQLFINEDEVAVSYLRDGYTAENYKTNKEWEGRLLVELSKCIKCPSIQYQLVGAKKIQQELAQPGVLEKFIPDPHVVKIIRATFADLYTLDFVPEGDEAVKKALSTPDKFVLKPQREGGGHNLYSEAITQFLTQHSSEREAYILMQRIFPWQQKNYLVKTGVPFELSTVVSELGIYGVYIGSEEEEVVNYECGHMMRTKISGTDEGGIVAGFAVLDTPLIIF